MNRPSLFKKCSKCRLFKTFVNFSKNSSLKDGFCNYCKTCAREKQAKYYEENKKTILENNKIWSTNNLERKREANRKWVENNKTRSLEKNRVWFLLNPDRANLYVRTRQLRKANAVPKWADLKAIASVYEEAQFCTEFFGIQFEVDHIIPISGKQNGKQIVCGLHWEKNLQVLTSTENRKKSAYFWPDMP